MYILVFKKVCRWASYQVQETNDLPQIKLSACIKASKVAS